MPDAKKNPGVLDAPVSLPSGHQTMKLTHIDSLRGIAILMVIIVHTAQSVQHSQMGAGNPGISGFLNGMAEYGQMGVQLFFVVSAFTLCLSMSNRSGERRKYVNFFIRRFFRIAPLYYFGIAYYALLSVVNNYLKTGEMQVAEQYTALNIGANVLFLHGFYPPANTNIVLGGWSIGTEVAFYVLFPLLFAMALRLKKLAAIWLLLTAGLLVTGDFYLVRALELLSGMQVGNNGFVYYNLANQILVFVIGIGLYFLEQRQLMVKWSWRLDALAFVFLTSMAMGVWKMDLRYAFFAIPIISSISFVFLYNVMRKNAHLNSRFIRKVGQLSFSMYVFHFIFAYQLSGVISRLLTPYLPADVLLLICYTAATAMTMLVAMVTEQWIEKPGIGLGRAIIRKISA